MAIQYILNPFTGNFDAINTGSGSAPIAPTVQVFDQSFYNTFSVSGATASPGSTYTNGTVTVTTTTNLTPSDSFWYVSSSAGFGGTLNFTLLTGTGDAAITIGGAIVSGGVYTRPTSPAPLYIRVVAVGGGGGGGGAGSAPASGGNGSSTTFGSSLLTATGGGGSNTSPGAGGSGTISSPAYGTVLPGSIGGAPQQNSGTSTAYLAGGSGGNSAYFAGAGSSDIFINAGTNGSPASGGGGGGSPSAPAINLFSGSGGGSGGTVDAIIPSPSATYVFDVGSGGGAGAGGTGTGGVGASGRIIVYEYYQ